MSKIRLFSWNVNGLRAVLKKQAIQNFLSTEDPDFCCFQEVKAKPEQVEKATHLEFKTAFEYWDETNKTWYFLTSKSNKIKFDKDIVNYKKVWYLEAN